MAEPSRNRPQEDDDGSCDSDSAETVVLADELGYGCDKGISFIRFMSVEGSSTTDGDLISQVPSKNDSKPRLSDLPTGLSILKNHAHFSDCPLPPGSFMFTECRVKMEMDGQRVLHEAENVSPFPPLVLSPSDSETNSPHSLPKINPIPMNPALAGVVPMVPSTNASLPQESSASESSSSDGQFKQPKLIPLSDLRYKNREAARKSRAKKKNYIQQLEHDFKELKVIIILLIFVLTLSITNKQRYFGEALTNKALFCCYYLSFGGQN